MSVVKPKKTKTLVCKGCRKRLPRSSFYKGKRYATGIYTSCKKCCGDEKREWAQRNREKTKKYSKAYRDKNLKKVRADNIKRQKSYPQRQSATNAVYRETKKDPSFRPNNCSLCRTKCKPEAHHKDYSNWLDVIWACKACHRSIHSGRIKPREWREVE